MNGYLYTLTLQEPVLASGLDGEPNSAQSLPYIPGGALRGAFIQAFTGALDADDDNFRRLFLSGETCYLNAYPTINEQRVLPASRKWQVERKPNPQEKPKKIFIDAKSAKGNDGETLDTKNVSFGFWTTKLATRDDLEKKEFAGVKEGETVLIGVSETWQVNVHTLRDAQLGRSTSEAGAVYRYVALPAGIQLQGAILTQSAEAKEGLKKIKDSLHGKIILLGKARTAGYGAVKIELQEMSADWQEWGLPGNLTDNVTLTLLSPAIVRDTNGQNSLDPTAALKARLGNSVEVKAIQRASLVIGGFNRAWGLPLPQMTAIAAGSVFSVTGAQAADLQKLAETGFGERRAEGFGRVALNLDLPASEMPLVDSPLALVAPKPASLANNNALARIMLERLMRRDLDTQVLRVARSLSDGYQGGLSNSQLSRWRVILRDALPKRDVQRVRDFCEKAKGKPGWKKMEKARLSLDNKKPRLTEWIESTLAGDKDWQRAWETHFQRVRKIGGVTLSAEIFADEYRLRLMDAVLAILSKQNNGTEKGGANG